ncbi:hypothetical protein BDV25DRAFT_156705 [Aspergillus avenaceus]|uniref:Uncharacterized protein n=1 Tax=Aspergillus avenaceus TaxID=36643 RepID=A0A5N6TT35_ASPAV|nr:hypothetical protein BDV25DRAFT_156705 [Aspergillus avenaceus]
MEILKSFLGRSSTGQPSGRPPPSRPSKTTMDPQCPRTETVQELARILDEETVVHVRGTPASGKTTLARLLHEYYRQQQRPSVIIYRWPHGVDHSCTNFLVRKAGDAGYPFITADTLQTDDIVFIIDESQASFGDVDLWLGFVKTQSGRGFGPRVCLFTAYGSPREGPNYGIGTTPVYFGIQQRVSISVSNIEHSPRIGLFYTRNEFDDVIQRKCSAPWRVLPLHHDAKDYIFGLTNGHPGAVDGVLGMIQKAYRSDIKHGDIALVQKHHIIELLNNEDKAFNYLAQAPVQRSFVNRKNLTVEAADVLRKVLVNGSISRDLGHEGIRLCYESGWLHSEALDLEGLDVVCIFPSRLHEKYVEHYLTASTVPFPIDRYPNIMALSEEVLRRFSPRNLSSRKQVGTGAVERHLEATYQDEFYRSLHDVLGFSTNVSSEWSGDGLGRIDFRITQVGWGIELLRDGDRLEAHCGRFVGSGIYTPWIENGWLRDWIIIDCRTSMPKPYNVPDTKLWRAVFKDDFSSVEVLNSNNEVVVSRFPLMS